MVSIPAPIGLEFRALDAEYEWYSGPIVPAPMGLEFRGFRVF